MATRNSLRIACLMDEAESQHRCAIIKRGDEYYRRAHDLAGRGVLVNPMKSLYARPEYWTNLDKGEKQLHILRALSVLHPRWVFCAQSAALLLGLAVSYADMGIVHIAVSPGHGTSSIGQIRRHTIKGLEDEIATVDGIRITSLERTLFDCMRSVPFPQALAIADSGLRRYRIGRQRILGYILARPANCHGRRAALDAVLHADASSESGGESIARAVMIEEGFLLPSLQIWMDDPIEEQGRFRVDYSWSLPDGTTVIGEMDGREKYTNPEMTQGRGSIEVLADERLRESHLSARTRIIRFGWKDVSNRKRFVKLLEAYGIPRLKLRPRNGFHAICRYSEQFGSLYSIGVVRVA